MAKVKEIISFDFPVGAGETKKDEERLKAKGEIKEVRMRFYSGQEKTLKILLYVLHKGQKAEYPIKKGEFVSGDNDYFVYPLTVPVENDDYLKIKAVNENDGGYIYDVVVDTVVEYYEEV